MNGVMRDGQLSRPTETGSGIEPKREDGGVTAPAARFERRSLNLVYSRMTTVRTRVQTLQG